MPTYRHLIAGDGHGNEIKLGNIKFDVALFLGDMIDENMTCLEREIYLKNLKEKVNRNGVKGVIFVEGNHEKIV